MFIPNGFKSSRATQQLQYDHDGRLREASVSRESAGVGDANSLYATEAEKFTSIAPFLARNREKDATRRNYVIQPGGSVIYFEGPAAPVGDESHKVDFPDTHTSFGHDHQPSGRFS